MTKKPKWKFTPPNYSGDERAHGASIDFVNAKGIITALVFLSAYPSEREIKDAKKLVAAANRGTLSTK